ncbi:hypothetical protein SUGI_0938400 [Cryptomeria japonica]|nr:hypothetical protein SUGI_0938400 [Cryptomeria japonica]
MLGAGAGVSEKVEGRIDDADDDDGFSAFGGWGVGVYASDSPVRAGELPSVMSGFGGCFAHFTVASYALVPIVVLVAICGGGVDLCSTFPWLPCSCSSPSPLMWISLLGSSGVGVHGSWFGVEIVDSGCGWGVSVVSEVFLVVNGAIGGCSGVVVLTLVSSLFFVFVQVTFIFYFAMALVLRWEGAVVVVESTLTAVYSLEDGALPQVVGDMHLACAGCGWVLVVVSTDDDGGFCALTYLFLLSWCGRVI